MLIAVLDFRGIAISKTAALTLLISQHVCKHTDVYGCQISLKWNYYRYATYLNVNFCVFKALQCIMMLMLSQLSNCAYCYFRSQVNTLIL